MKECKGSKIRVMVEDPRKKHLRKGIRALRLGKERTVEYLLIGGKGS